MANTNNRPLILVTNDDGYKAKGILKLTEFAMDFGDVVVVSASESQSGKSHSITIKDPIRYKLLDEKKGFSRYIVKGTPADGVKLALNKLMNKKPNIILSGINHGTNSSTSVVYSGTMGAAIEGAIHQIPSIGFSILNYSPDADFDSAAPFVKQIIGQGLSEGLPEGICLNVNIPAVERNKIKGIKVCRQTNGLWLEEFETREDPRGAKYTWLSGSFINREPEARDTDEWALKNDYLSVVPIRIDYTAHDLIVKMQNWEIKSSFDEKNRKVQ